VSAAPWTLEAKLCLHKQVQGDELADEFAVSDRQAARREQG
jgi:hypothetical protein